jgi:hypothetical protein
LHFFLIIFGFTIRQSTESNTPLIAYTVDIHYHNMTMHMHTCEHALHL